MRCRLGRSPKHEILVTRLGELPAASVREESPAPRYESVKGNGRFVERGMAGSLVLSRGIVWVAVRNAEEQKRIVRVTGLEDVGLCSCSMCGGNKFSRRSVFPFFTEDRASGLRSNAIKGHSESLDGVIAGGIGIRVTGESSSALWPPRCCPGRVVRCFGRCWKSRRICCVAGGVIGTRNFAGGRWMHFYV